MPKLPRTEDGARELRALDARVRQHRNSPAALLPLLLERATIRGQLDDYVEALAVSAAFVKTSPANPTAWQLRVEVLLRAHDFAAARAALGKLATLVDPSHLVAHELILADAAGQAEQALALRKQLADQLPSAHRLTIVAVSLAQLDRFGEAIELIPKAASAVRDNPPQLVAWLYFQWGRIYELRGELATARDFFAAAHERMPGYVEAAAHLASAMNATGDAAGARRVVEEAFAHSRHPELIALAVELGSSELLEDARTEWERYVTALPLAFADHAARFYLGVGRDPKRALELARMNLKNRDTHAARALVIEAALATGDAATACNVVAPLVSTGTRAQRFVAWQALSRCGRTIEASELGRALGIAP